MVVWHNGCASTLTCADCFPNRARGSSMRYRWANACLSASKYTLDLTLSKQTIEQDINGKMTTPQKVKRCWVLFCHLVFLKSAIYNCVADDTSQHLSDHQERICIWEISLPPQTLLFPGINRALLKLLRSFSTLVDPRQRLQTNEKARKLARNEIWLRRKIFNMQVCGTEPSLWEQKAYS